MTDISLTEKIEKEVKENYIFFKENLSKLIEQHKDKFLIIRNKKIEDVCDTGEEAILKAKEKFPDEIYSIQQVGEKEVDLGSISAYAVF